MQRILTTFTLHVAIFLTVSTVISPSFAEPFQCEKPKKLSEILEYYPEYLIPFKDKLDSSTSNWAIEYSGVDLAKSLIPKGLEKTSVAVLDAGFQGHIEPSNRDAILYRTTGRHIDDGNHGSAVTNIINGSGRLSVSKNAQIEYMLDDPAYEDVIHLFSDKGYPKLLNNSSLDYVDSDFQSTLRKLIENKVVYVGSGGNGFPSPFRLREIFEEILVVGWIGNDGLYYAESTSGEHIDLVAPSGISMLVKESEDDIGTFGGSSGAAPHLTGVLADLVSILGTNDFKILETLVKNSSLSYPLKNSRNGAGSLNAFKAASVALRLKRNCGSNLKCLKHEVQNKNNYSFVLSQSNASKVLRKCQTRPKEFSIENFCEYKSELDELRKNFFLTRDQTSSRALSCIYNEMGFPSNANFYGIYSGNEDAEKVVRTQSDEGFLRNAPYFSKYPEEEFNSRLQSILASLQKEGVAPFKRVMTIGKIIENAMSTSDPLLYFETITSALNDVDYTIEGSGALNLHYLLNRQPAELIDKILVWIIRNKKVAVIERIICYEKERKLQFEIFSKAARSRGYDMASLQLLDEKVCEEILHR